MIEATDYEECKALTQKARQEGSLVWVVHHPALSDATVADWIQAHTSRRRTEVPTRTFWGQLRHKVLMVATRRRSRTELFINLFAALALMIVGHLLFSYITYERLVVGIDTLLLEENFLYFVLGGFIAQLIDGALGMAYGVTATTFLLTLGVPPSVASASVHSSEIFTSGVSGYMHLKFGNVNSKLFKTLLVPGIIGAILGAYALTTLEQYMYIVKPIVAVYTLILGALIIRKALKKRIQKRPIKNIGWLAVAGGTLDSIGGGGWGPIVSSTLIARGRHPRYTIGSVNLTEFFVSLASSLAFISLIGFSHWQVILGLILGGMVAAPIAASLSRRLPVKTMMILVGIVVIVVSLRIIFMVASTMW